jgi:hypothetical protein
MDDRRFTVGEKVLASRDEGGETREQGTVVDSYELLIGEERRPMVLVEFDDGERRYLRATAPNVVPAETAPEAGHPGGDESGQGDVPGEPTPSEED